MAADTRCISKQIKQTHTRFDPVRNSQLWDSVVQERSGITERQALYHTQMRSFRNTVNRYRTLDDQIFRLLHKIEARRKELASEIEASRRWIYGERPDDNPDKA